MSQEHFLVDAQDGRERFKVLSLLANGRSYQIVRVEDTQANEPGAQTLCARAVLYDTGYSTDADYVRIRREAVREEWAFLEKMKSPLLPTPIALLNVAIAPEDLPELEDAESMADEPQVEPVLVCDWQDGLTIFEWIRREHPEGLPSEQALDLMGELIAFLQSVHAAGYVFRDLDPRHFIVGEAGEIPGESVDGEASSPKMMTLTRVVGFGNATVIAERPNQAKFHY